MPSVDIMSLYYRIVPELGCILPGQIITDFVANWIKRCYYQEGTFSGPASLARESRFYSKRQLAGVLPAGIYID